MTLVRRAVLEDMDGICQLWLQMMGEHFANDPRFQLAADAETAYKEQLRELLNNPEIGIFVAGEPGEAIGYTIAMILQNPPCFALKFYGFIAEMAVSQEHRNEGVGHALWERASRWFKRKNITVAQLNVSPQNEGGKRFWNSLGFQDFLTIQWCELGDK